MTPAFDKASKRTLQYLPTTYRDNIINPGKLRDIDNKTRKDVISINAL
jgi:hypothetical protein